MCASVGLRLLQLETVQVKYLRRRLWRLLEPKPLLLRATRQGRQLMSEVRCKGCRRRVRLLLLTLGVRGAEAADQSRPRVPECDIVADLCNIWAPASAYSAHAGVQEGVSGSSWVSFKSAMADAFAYPEMPCFTDVQEYLENRFPEMKTFEGFFAAIQYHFLRSENRVNVK